MFKKIKNITAVMVFFIPLLALFYRTNAHAEVLNDGCPDVKIIFARGSGGEIWTDRNFVSFRDALNEKLIGTTLTYGIVDLDYPAIGIGDLKILIGAYFGAGEAYEFGESIQNGVDKLTQIINGTCQNTKFVIAGYSQGAIVVSKSLPGLNPNKILYAATFGDPKIYLPEGKGVFPDACLGKNLSNYREYVPDCHAYEGLLGAYKPYVPNELDGKVGTWCNTRDIFCSSYLSIDSHTSYVADNLYADAAEKIASKIMALENAMQEVAILIDDSWFMNLNLAKYKAYATQTIAETINNGGRVAFYSYGAAFLGAAEVTKYCDFLTCTISNTIEYLNDIEFEGGRSPIYGTGSALYNPGISAINQVLSDESWDDDMKKNLVLLTDGGLVFFDVLHDLDSVTMNNQNLDVRISIVTEEKSMRLGALELASMTGGKAIDVEDVKLEQNTELGQNTEKKIKSKTIKNANVKSRNIYTADIETPLTSASATNEDIKELPTLIIHDIHIDDNTATISFSSSSRKAIVSLDDAILGVVLGEEITICDLDFNLSNLVRITAINDERRGKTVEILLNEYIPRNEMTDAQKYTENDNSHEFLIPKAPNTGRLYLL